MNFLRRISLAILLLGTLAGASAQAPASYYSSLIGKKDADLKTAVYELIHNFTLISSYQDLPQYFKVTDVYPDSRRWWDMYSNIPLYSPSFSGLNREHSFPKSWWGGATDVPAYVDLNHLYPSEADANMAKSNWPLGTVNRNSKIEFENGVTTVGYPVNGQGGGAQKVFEPDDQYKGDFARTYFYMVTCYQTYTWRYNYMVSSNTYPTLLPWAVDLLLKWHHDDPVSQKEIDRNNRVYGYQNNRNPFIDLPELADYIWGSEMGKEFKPGTITPPAPVGDPELTAPTTGMTLEFGQVALGKAVTAKLFVKASNLTGPTSVKIYTADAAMFSTAISSIQAAQACSEDGFWLNITYTPTSIGEHSSRILLSGDFGSRGVALRGQCLETPTLGACTATAPTNITSNSYTANWTAPESDIIDYYIVTRTRFQTGKATTAELLAEENYLEIDDFDKSDSESYSVQSVRLGYRSPMSNVVFVDHTGITGVQAQQPLLIATYGNTIRFTVGAPHTNARIYDTTGTLIIQIPQLEDNTEIELPYGVYLIVTDQHTAPVKAAVK